MNKKFLVVTFSMALCLWGVYSAFFAGQNNGEKPYQSPREITGSTLGGGFALVGEDGGVFTDKDLTRPYRIIYFGFTYCPAICPTELAKITRAVKALPAALQEKIDLVFITIDPERDTPEVLKDYTDLFHPRLIGLGGPSAQVDAVLKEYKVFASKVQDETMSDYTMDHSSYIYLFTNENQLRAMYRIDDEAPFIAQDLIHLLQ
jgi:protein SCO1/2